MFKKHYALALVCAVAIAGGLFFLDNSSGTVAKGDGEATFTGVELTCGDCKERLQNVMSNLLAIREIEMHPKNDSVTVIYNDRYMEDEWIAKALESVGFTVNDIK